MKLSFRRVLALFAGLATFFVPFVASAHEAYVLDHDYFWSVMQGPISPDVMAVLHNAHDVHVMIEVIVGVLVLLSLNFFFRRSKLGKRANARIEEFAYLGPHFVRIAVAIAFFYGAKSSHFLGPELPLAEMPWAHVLQIVMYASSVMIFLGFLTELAGLAAIIVFTIGLFSFGMYLMTYLNYLGECIALFLFGLRTFSIDSLLFGSLKRFRKLREYDTTIVRVFYGFALIWAAVTVKLLHPELTEHVVNQYNLTRFHLLFPGDPLLVTLGAGLVEAAIGFFIIVGFEMRMTILVSLFYITLSLLFFREQVWPHVLLYGISFMLLVSPENFTLDHIFFGEECKKKSIWKRIRSPHKKGN
jgi:hypothetical protein